MTQQQTSAQIAGTQQALINCSFSKGKLKEAIMKLLLHKKVRSTHRICLKTPTSHKKCYVFLLSADLFFLFGGC